MANSPVTPVKVNYATGDVLTAQNLDDEASAINRLAGFRTQATANSTLTLTVTDSAHQEFTGATAGQIVQMPVTSTLGVGMPWIIANKSTQTIAVNSSGGNLIYTVPAATTATFTCNAITGTTAASWSYDVSGFSTPPSTTSPMSLFYTTTLVATATTISVPSIPGTSKNIRVVWHGKGPGASTANIYLRFNADTAANYDFQRLYGVGNGGSSANESFGQAAMMVGRMDAVTASGSIIIPNYASTVLNKNAVGHFFAKYGTATGNLVAGIHGGSWRNSAAITQLDFTTDSGDFQIGTHFDVYLEN